MLLMAITLSILLFQTGHAALFWLWMTCEAIYVVLWLIAEGISAANR